MKTMIGLVGLLSLMACGDPQGNAGAIGTPAAKRLESQDDKHKAPAVINNVESKAVNVQGGTPIESKAVNVQGGTPIER